MVEDFSNLSVLIVGYKRYDNIIRLINLSLSLNVHQIFVSIDGYKNLAEKEVTDQILGMLTSTSNENPNKVKFQIQSKNMGSAVNVIKSCDWFFSNVKEGIILEDDCIPSVDFFSFVKSKFYFLEQNKSTLLICGTQFVPTKNEFGFCYLSKYALTWGWATNSKNWNIIRSFFYEKPILKFSIKVFIDPRHCFWIASERRAREGFTDVWDGILVSSMLRNKFYALAPEMNLVTNIGSDQYALHTKPSNAFLNLKCGFFHDQPANPMYNLENDLWLDHFFYQIRIKHIFSTKLTFCLDYFFKKKRKKFQETLVTRLEY